MKEVIKIGVASFPKAPEEYFDIGHIEKPERGLAGLFLRVIRVIISVIIIVIKVID